MSEHAARVLVVDDEAPVLRLVSMILERAGFAVCTASCGLEALDAVQRQPDSVDLILTDVVMPDLEGPALAERCRSIRPDLPVLFMTGYRERVTDRTIPKPFTPAGLIGTVRGALSSH